MRTIEDGAYRKIRALARSIDKQMAEFGGSLEETETIQTLTEMLVAAIGDADDSIRKE